MYSAHFNIAIIGGGAAGIMAAISAGESGCNSISIFESNSRFGTKILMSGGTRCNVTNDSVSPVNFYGGNKNFIKNILSAFGDKDTIQFFKQLGVELKLEPGGKYFPSDDKAQTVLKSLLNRISELKVKTFHSSKVISISFQDNKFVLQSEKYAFSADKIIITTGGKSYPSTGSDGSGYDLVKQFGHSLIEPFPALTPILLNDNDLTTLSGITIPAKLTLHLDNKKVQESENSLLFTHFGISGPAALNISREVERLKKLNIELTISFLPGYNFDQFQNLLLSRKKELPNQNVLTFCREFLPVKLCHKLLFKSNIESDSKFHSISSKQIRTIVEIFINYKLNFTGVRGFNQAEVTAGGVPLAEVKYQTMESKLQPGMFLAGEILDVDGLIGGYNFQWAWSTGYIAGKSAAKSV